MLRRGRKGDIRLHRVSSYSVADAEIGAQLGSSKNTHSGMSMIAWSRASWELCAAM